MTLVADTTNCCSKSEHQDAEIHTISVSRRLGRSTDRPRHECSPPKRASLGRRCKVSLRSRTIPNCNCSCYPVYRGKRQGNDTTRTRDCPTPELRQQRWKDFRSHRGKNVAWIIPEPYLKGARTLESLRLASDPSGDHTVLLD